MTTSGDGVDALLYVAVVAVSVAAIRATLGDAPQRHRGPDPVLAAIWLCVALPSLLGLIFAGVYRALLRDPAAIKEHGEVWRLLTGAIVQDGGVPGTVFNLVILAVVVAAALEVFGPVRTPALLLAGALGFNLLATYAFASRGAGNSAATFFLATAAASALARRVRRGPALAAAAAGVAAGIVLIVRDDAHGVAMLAGAVVGVALG